MLTGSRRIVFLTLQQLLERTPTPTIFQLAMHTGYEPKTVQAALADLEEKYGLIQRERDNTRQGRPYRYEVIELP